MAARCHPFVTAACLAIFLVFGAIAAPSLDAPIKTILAVGPEGHGNAAAGAAVKSLSSAKLDALPQILTAMDGANDYALNWLRAAVETITQRETLAGKAIPVAELETFLNNRKHHPRARRLAYELIERSDVAKAEKMLGNFLNDPSAELRFAAVQQIVDQTTKGGTNDKPAAIAGYRKALGSARDALQIDAIAGKLAELGDKVDLQKTFGWVTQWKVVGPFDNTGGIGFDKVYPPETGVDTTAEYDGKVGKVRWQDYQTHHDYGQVDLNQPLTMTKGVTGYAYAEFWSATARAVQVRLGSQNGWKVWVNGKFLFGRDEYHRADEIDQFRLPVELKPGKNVILVKCLQNEQTEDWAKDWQFQLRVTDDEGTPIASAKQ
ncbi:MAG TPA: hypothetical protein VMF06_05795 [Candidatus Limnocylindria bacterium]|jgi:hypothetical protein|nr:hypothetical protein [Candidatus Limnocylindria bacterium]